MISRDNKLQNKRLRGFTLIELSIVLVISSLLLVSGLEAFQIYRSNHLLTETRDRQKLIVTALANFKDNPINGYLPCPADPSLHFTDPLSGVANCVPALLVGTCSGGGLIGICKVLGARDTIADLDTAVDTVLIGAIPYKTLQSIADTVKESLGYSSIETSQDSWGYQMGYAVSEYLTIKATYNVQHGSISVTTELGVPLSSPIDSVHYAIIGYGKNHIGAYTTEGIRTLPCTVGRAESDNCMPSSDFVSGLYSTNSNNASYFDDNIMYSSFAVTKLWAFDATNPLNIYNLNSGNVGFGILSSDDPDERLEIRGTLRAEEVHQGLVCDTSPVPVCWDPNNLASSAGTRCETASPLAAGNIRVVNRVEGAEVKCTDIPVSQILASQTCATPGEYIIGFDQFGAIICEVP